MILCWKYIVTMEEQGQFLLILTNFVIRRIFYKIFVRIYFREWWLMKFFAEFLRKKQRVAKLAKINLSNN